MDQLDELPIDQLVFRDVTWISRHGTHVVYAGEAEFDPGWRPRSAQLRRPGLRPFQLATRMARFPQ